ncbi:MAG TPA: hypothetical protein VFK52_00995 [Nocardioidaceae bacterium]|nr:hypothetical protein [Nocardioidaceae bacterium]
MRRRSFASATALGLVLASSLLPSTPARAAVFVTEPKLTAQATVFAYGGAGCSASNNGKTDVTPLELNGEPQPRSLQNTAVVSDVQGPSTSISQTLSGYGSASLRNGRLSSFDLEASGRVELDATGGQTCGTGQWTSLHQGLDFTIDEPQWLTVSLVLDRQTSAWLEASNEEGTTWFEIDNGENGGTSTITSYLPPGDYDLEASIGWGPWLEPGQDRILREGSGEVHLRLHDIGSALGAATGTGRKYVGLGAQVSCGAPSLPARFTRSAGRVRSASFVVNGTVVKTVRAPQVGQRVAVRVPRFGQAHVKVVLVVDPPGDTRSAKVAVTRSYRACSAR